MNAFTRVLGPGAMTVLAQLAMSTAASQAAPSPMHWYRGNTHTHTRFSDQSDANSPPIAVARWYREHGYQFVVITDHEHLTDVAPLNAAYAQDGKFLVIRGQEVTQVIADPHHLGGVRHAHVTAIDTDKLIMPLLPPQAGELRGIMRMAALGVSLTETYQRNLASIEAAGGIAQINHPNLLWSVELSDLLPVRRPFLLEIWNGYPDSNNLGGTDAAGHNTPSAEALWDSLLTAGKVVWGTGSDDSHVYDRFDQPGAPTPGRAWVVACAKELSDRAIVEALKRGNFYASTGIKLRSYAVDANGISLQIEPLPDWSPNLMPSSRYTTRFVGEGGKVLSEDHGLSPHFTFTGSEHYARAAIIDSDGRRAWTQPVFRDGRKAPGYLDATSLHASCLEGS